MFLSTNTKRFFISFLFFGLPFFFLTITQDYFSTNKFYLLAIFFVLGLIIQALILLRFRKISFYIKKLDLSVIIFLLSLLSLLLISSTNRIEAILNSNFGLAMFVFLTFVYFYTSRLNDLNQGESNHLPIQIMSIILSLITIIFFFQPFKNINLSQSLIFFKSPIFTPIGSQIDLLIYLGFFLIINVFSLLKTVKINRNTLVLSFIALTTNLLAILLSIYLLVTKHLLQLLTPFNYSWYASLEILKNFKTALFGIGIGNYSIIFNKIKDVLYNQSPFWQNATVNISHSAILQIFTETGVIGLISFGLLVFYTIKQILRVDHARPLHLCLFFYLFICLLIFPPSIINFFLFYLILGYISQQERSTTKLFENDSPTLSVFLSLIIMSLSIVIGYFTVRSFLSEYYYKKSIDGLTNKQIETAYNNMKKARILNPFNEKVIISFSQTNLIIANSLAGKKEKINKTDKQTIAQAIQTSISEAKEVIRLNPNKSFYYSNLGSVYKSIITIAKGSDAWAISAYQRAIVLDPANPVYQLDLGGTYYTLARYEDAVNLFLQTINLKPDFANGYYNLAWSYYQNKQYDKAVNAMQNTLKLIDKKTNKNDWEKANNDLLDFKKKLEK